MKIKKISISIMVSLSLLTSYVNAASSGWEAVDDYSAIGMTNLWYSVDAAEWFEIAILNYSNWNNKFGWDDNLAWEEDFKKDTEGGTDSLYADNVNLMYFNGHGNKDGFYFGTNLHDNKFVHHSEVEWGDESLDWIIIDACEVLDNRDKRIVYSRWGKAFNGLHYIFGHSSIAWNAETRGEDFIKYAMGSSLPVREAWVRATRETGAMSQTKAAYLRAGDTYNDHLYGFGTVFIPSATKSEIRHVTWQTL